MFWQLNSSFRFFPNVSAICILSVWRYISGLMQDCSISIANVLVILHPCTKPSVRISNMLSPKQCDKSRIDLISGQNRADIQTMVRVVITRTNDVSNIRFYAHISLALHSTWPQKQGHMDCIWIRGQKERHHHSGELRTIAGTVRGKN